MLKYNRFVDILHDAHNDGFAVGAFNIFNEQTARGVVRAANKAGAPVIIQVSTGTVRKLGVKALGGMVNAMKFDAPNGLALHLDHCSDPELARCCIRHGWDSVMMDYSHFPISENIEKTKEIVDYAHERNVAVEGEVGLVLGAEEDVVSNVERLAEEDETIDFIEKTGVDAIAPAVGTAHGLYKPGAKLNLNYKLIENLSKRETSVVIHGGTGLEDAIYRRLVKAGASKINISTAVKYAYAEGVKKSSQTDIPEAPLQADEMVEKSVCEVVYRLIRLFKGDE